MDHLKRYTLKVNTSKFVHR